MRLEVAFCFLALVAGCFANDLYKNVTQLITEKVIYSDLLQLIQQGYPCEEHSIITLDGFILGYIFHDHHVMNLFRVQRIPSGKTQK
jgi:hypothetical protein